jgi:chromosome segregation ATPase
MDEDLQAILDGYDDGLEMVDEEINELVKRMQNLNLEKAQTGNDLDNKRAKRKRIEAKIAKLKREHPECIEEASDGQEG